MTDHQNNMSVEGAQRDLASAEAMGLIARQRIVWPRWAAAIDALGLGVMMTLMMVFWITFPGNPASTALIWGMLAVIWPSLWLRFHMRKRLGAMPRPGWPDLWWNLLYWAAVGVGVAVVHFGGWAGTPYAIGALLAVMHYILRRHGRVV